jgi:hypothetical protein
MLTQDPFFNKLLSFLLAQRKMALSSTWQQRDIEIVQDSQAKNDNDSPGIVGIIAACRANPVMRITHQIL